MRRIGLAVAFWAALAGFVVLDALSSAPRKDDVGRLKFAALTTGADAAAPALVKASVEGMVKWSRRA
jgi:hypothetical protein